MHGRVSNFADKSRYHNRQVCKLTRNTVV